MAEPDSIADAKHVDPYLLPPERQGWRGLGVPGAHKRKWYTILHNEQVLVTALLLIPGERSIRHSHESGELSIHYYGDLNPVVSWNPPGALHPSLAEGAAAGGSELERMVGEAAAQAGSNSAMGQLLRGLLEEQLRLRERLDEVLRPRPAPFVIVDILFPPFKTKIDDPAAPDQRTVVGQWYD
jgi:hypothetical protein